MIAQIVVFSRKTDAQRKKNFAFRSAKIAQKFCEWKPYICCIMFRAGRIAVLGGRAGFVSNGIMRVNKDYYTQTSK